MGWNEVAIEDGCQPFQIVVNSDLASTQILVDKGGPYKHKIYGCHLFAEHRDCQRHRFQCYYLCCRLHGDVLQTTWR
jgi:hypothetical protein